MSVYLSRARLVCEGGHIAAWRTHDSKVLNPDIAVFVRTTGQG